MSRVPEKTKKLFVELADKEFAEDYGLTLKFLLDFYTSISPLLARMDEFEIRLLKLEGNMPKTEEPKIKTLNGTILK